MNILLVPLAIAAFIVFLLLLGTIGLLVSMAVIGAVGRLWRFLNRSGGRRRS